MKKILNLLRARNTVTSRQEELIRFVTDEDILRKAIEGSMGKRIELLERVELKEKHV